MEVSGQPYVLQPLQPWGKHPGIHWIDGRMGPRADVGILVVVVVVLEEEVVVLVVTVVVVVLVVVMIV